LKDVLASGEVVRKQNTTYYGANARAGKMTLRVLNQESAEVWEEGGGGSRE